MRETNVTEFASRETLLRWFLDEYRSWIASYQTWARGEEGTRPESTKIKRNPIFGFGQNLPCGYNNSVDSLTRMKTVLITGSSGLIGSEAVQYFDLRGYRVVGVDNNMRRLFFGDSGDTTRNLERMKCSTRRFTHHDLDIRNREGICDLFRMNRPDLIIHCAGQPSHDKAKEIPILDFEVNAVGTLNLLETARQFSPEAVFIFMSTNKVYGDAPNELPLCERATRYDYARSEDYEGIRETCRIDQTLHSVFGASKVAADIMVQEYGRYYGMNVGIFRGGCLTGPGHAGVELHGFLSYLVKVAFSGQTYKVFGYKGKQVRDNIHSYDVVRAFEEFARDPRSGEVYNLGGGRGNSISVLEAIERVQELIGKDFPWVYQEQARKGDHICYISDIRKFQSNYPGWCVTRDLNSILREMIEAERKLQMASSSGRSESSAST
jgi:CDP-paratose 2-epimerase